jgi:hypothetical protein
MMLHVNLVEAGREIIENDSRSCIPVLNQFSTVISPDRRRGRHKDLIHRA